MPLPRKIIYSVAATYVFIAASISLSRALDIPWGYLGDWGILLTGALIGGSIYLFGDNVLLNILSTGFFVVINIALGYIFMFVYVCWVHGLCL